MDCVNRIDLYTAPVPNGDIGSVFCQLRQKQIAETVHPELKRQRYYAWKLLEYAAQNSFGLDPQTLEFTKDSTGKWHCDRFCFSLSHCREAVIVAVSSAPVGVDIECTERTVAPGLANTVLTPAEHNFFDRLSGEEHNRYLLSKWCAKESLFKAGEFAVFQPKKLETGSGVREQTLEIGNKTYYCAVAAEDLSQLRIFQNITLC